MKHALDRYASHYLFLHASGVRDHIFIYSESFYLFQLAVLSLYFIFFCEKYIYRVFSGTLCFLSFQITAYSPQQQGAN